MLRSGVYSFLQVLGGVIISSLLPLPWATRKIWDKTRNAQQHHDQSCNPENIFGRVSAPSHHDKECQCQEHRLDDNKQARNNPKNRIGSLAYNEKSADEHNKQTHGAWAANEECRGDDVFVCHSVLVLPNDVHQWRARNDAGDETDAQSARPLNARRSALLRSHALRKGSASALSSTPPRAMYVAMLYRGGPSSPPISSSSAPQTLLKYQTMGPPKSLSINQSTGP